MLYNVTKIYVFDNQVLYIDEGEISRNSANYNKIDVITPATGYGIGIAFELPNGVYTDEFALTQETGAVSLPDVTSLQAYQGEQWSSYTMLIPNAVLSAITSTTSQTLGFSLRFTKGVTNLESYDEKDDFPSVGLADKVYFDDELNDYYIWDGTAYVEKTSSEASALIVSFNQAYSTERAFLSIQGTVGGEPLALDPAFYQSQIVSKYNELVSLYNQLKSSVGDPTTGLAQKVTKSGDTMTGTLTFSNADETRLVLGNNVITTDATINATSFDNGDNVSDALKFSDLTSLFDLGTVTPGSGENFLTAYSNALESKFAAIKSEAELNNIYLRIDGTVAMTDDLNLNNNDIINLDGIASVKTAIDGKVDKTTTIAGLDLQDNITLEELKTQIGNATQSLDGLLSSEDKETIDTLTDLLKADDQDNVVNTIQEILNVFATYPEGTDIATTLGNKVDKVTGKGLSEEDFTTTLKDKLDGIEAAAEVNVQADWDVTDTGSDAHILNKPSVYTQTELDGGQLDIRYYTEGEVDSLLADKVNLSDLETTLTVYATDTYESGGNFDGYAQLVTNQSDSRYNDTAVEVYTTNDRTATGTSVLTSTDPNNPSLVGQLIADAEVFDLIGANTNITTIGQVKKHAGNPNENPRLRFRMFKSDDLVNPIAVSGYTDIVDNDDYENIFESALVQSQVDFTNGERLVILYEAYTTAGTPIVAIKFGGNDPARTVIPQTFEATFSASNIIYDDTDNVEVLGGNVKDALDAIESAFADYAKTGDIPTNNTELTNGAGYITDYTVTSADVTTHQGDLTIAQSQVTNLTTDLGLKADLVGGKVPSNQLPSFVDDVIEGYYNTSDGLFYTDAGFTAGNEITGETGKVYVDLVSGANIYRWSGSAFTQIIEAVAFGTIAGTAYEGNAGQANADAIEDLLDGTTTAKKAEQDADGNVITTTYATKTELSNATIDTLNDIGNVDTTGAITDSVLKYDPTANAGDGGWVIGVDDAGTTISTLDDVGDVDTSTVAANEFIKRNAANDTWENHALSKTDVGLNNVQNYGIATQSEAETGTLDNEYMTPLKTKQAIAANYSKGVIESNATTDTGFWVGTQTQYDALVSAGTIDNNTLYFIKG